MNDYVQSRRSHLRSKAKFLTGISSILLLAALPFLTDAACNLLVLLGLLASSAAIGLAWLVMTVRFLPLTFSAKIRLWWLGVPFVGVFGFTLLATDHALALRVAMSEWALLRYVKALPAGVDRERAPQWVGLFYVDKTDVRDGDVYVYTNTSLFDRFGVAYMPDHNCPAQGFRAHHLYGPWYRFKWKF